MLGCRTLAPDDYTRYPTGACPISDGFKLIRPNLVGVDPVRCMTFNIRVAHALDRQNRWYRRRELVLDVLREHRPQLLGLQEVVPFQLNEILGAFPALGAIADRRYAGRMGTYAPILFDRNTLEPAQSGDFWLAPDPDGSRQRGWDAAVPRICTWAVFRVRGPQPRRFAVFNTHFDQAGVSARVESARLVVSRLDSLRHFPRLVMADLNANESSEALGLLRATGLRDSFRDLHPDEEAFTFHGFRGKGVRNLGKIDYILCDGSWETLAAGVVRGSRAERYPSDHFPVTAELRLRR
jgi:endonuclease/exonuclease/phosphatase family metal-dependent hydrolase